MRLAGGTREMAVAAVATIAFSSCAADDATAPPATAEGGSTTLTERPTTPTSKPSPPTQRPALSTAAPKPTIAGTRPPSSTPVPGSPLPSRDVPSIAAVIDDLAQRLVADPATLTIVDYRDVTWADGSLGCPKPDMSYIQQLIPGLLLVLEAGDGTRHEYHAGPTATLFYCASPRPPIEDRDGDAA